MILNQDTDGKIDSKIKCLFQKTVVTLRSAIMHQSLKHLNLSHEFKIGQAVNRTILFDENTLHLLSIVTGEISHYFHSEASARTKV